MSQPTYDELVRMLQVVKEDYRQYNEYAEAEIERLRAVEAVATKVRDWWDRTDVIAARRTDLSREEDALWEELDAALNSIPEVSA